MNFQSDEVVAQIFEVAKKFDDTAYTKPWNGKKQRLIAKLHYGNEKDPGRPYRTEITSAKETIYWWIGLQSHMYLKYGKIIDKYDDKRWKADPEHGETRIKFESTEKFFSFVDECLGKTVDNSDINTPLPPKGMSADGFVVICPRCNTKFKCAERCPECGQLMLYESDK